eukprot:312606-Rhodomonas_salina.1
MSGTEVACAAMKHAIAYALPELQPPWPGPVSYAYGQPRYLLRAPYATHGTEIAYGATRSLRSA